MEKIYNKLVRDKIPDVCYANNEKAIYHILSDDEYRIELIKKMGEELLEVRLANTKGEMTLELADILEIVFALNKYLGNTEQELFDVRSKKLISNGGFDKRIFLEKVIKEDIESL